MSNNVWKDLADIDRPAKGGSDEFGPEVAHAIAQIRAANGMDEGHDAPPTKISGDAARFRDEIGSALPAVNRRGFLQLTGAAAVFALAGCWHEDPDVLVPYAQQPEGTTLGKPVWWSTVLRDSGRPVPVMVKTYDGRPIKIEGNPDSPVNGGKAVRGACDLATQAALLNLYDPDRRIRGPAKRAAGTTSDLTWDALDAEVGALLKTGKVLLVTGPIDGLARRSLIDAVVAGFGDRLTHVAYDPYAADRAAEARRWCFGTDQAKPPVYHLEKASLLVTLGSDFLGGGQTGLREQVAYGDFRRLRGAGAHADMGQVIAFEPTMSQTGTVADIRVRASMDQVERLAWGLAKYLGAEVPAALKPAMGNELGLKSIEKSDAVQYVGERLKAIKAAGGHSLIYVGGATHMGARSDSLHVAANLINSLLGNEGVTVETASQPASAIFASAAATAAALDAVDGDTVVVLADVNPAYSLPGAAAALAKAKAVVVLADREDESFQAAGSAYLAPSLHGLEAWGDAEPIAGVHAIQQPVIRPLWDCRSVEDSLIALTVAALGEAAPKALLVEAAPADPKLKTVCSQQVVWQGIAKGLRPFADLVKATWIDVVRERSAAISTGQTFWNAALATGVVGTASAKAAAATFNAVSLASLKAAEIADGFQVVVSASRTMGTGRNANNAWLQETPDPVSRITWDNYLAVSPKDAATFGADRQTYSTGYENPVVSLTIGGSTVTLPVHVQEGQHPGTLELFLGWGRRHAGKVAEGAGPGLDGGVNAFALGSERWGIAVQPAATGARYRLACTQGHSTMDGRDIVRDDNLEHFRADPGKEKRDHAHHHALWINGTDGDHNGRLSMWGSSHVYAGRRWGMTVDLTTCTGCHACLTACTAENNVPVVGRDEVRIGREMHWLRIDRYYSSPDWHKNHPGETREGKVATEERIQRLLDVDVTHMPVMCQQCGHAPCEEVCPAMATMHNDEGINVQVYNRCIGTRYCGNNCPYKVRRFNYYEYSKYRFGPQGSGEPFNRVMKNLSTEMRTSSTEELSRAPLQMLLNPVVSVRSKGVMEKCNFCIQRIRDVREEEKTTGKQYDDRAKDRITSACAQTCPTGAIVFGDIHKEDSEVNEVARSAPHRYRLLDKELNTRPSVLYFQRIRHRGPSESEAKYLAEAMGGGHGAAPEPHAEGAPTGQAGHGEGH